MRLNKLGIIILCFGLLLLPNSIAHGFSINARAAILMDPISGRVLYAQNEHQRLPPASVTKVMTMLLILEAVHQGRIKWDETITTSAKAYEMGGSQVFLKEGEEFPLREMFKAIAVVSANDASAAVAEHLYGSVDDFVEAMNQRAKKLGLKDTHFDNETGLPDPAHYSSTYDLAVISRELLKYPEILKFTSIWLDSFRNGKFVLRNTNELIRLYRGADGLKTGHTDEAKFCLSATAKRGDFRLLSIILGADSDDQRVEQSKRILDYGFRNFQWQQIGRPGEVGKIYIKDARPSHVPVRLKTEFGTVIARGPEQVIQTRLEVLKNLKLPINAGTKIGTLKALVNHKEIASVAVYSMIKVKPANLIIRWWRAFWELAFNLFKGKKS
ncbi:MAG TPA: D-alanyl-D-alanine carboxypeptidase [Firmicutes bacterium]|nr:D-alanyl-D-alanine carboxypeptidase [Bacillota bacterium]